MYANTATSSIEICGLKIYAYHGVLEQEALVGNMFELNVILNYDASYAMRNDRLDQAVNYADVVELIKTVMATPSQLLENVVYRLYFDLVRRYQEITGGLITIYKLNPPIPARLDKVGFTFKW